MLKKLYYLFHQKTSRLEERGEYSAGHWQDVVRTKALEICPAFEGNLLEVGCGEGLFLTRLAEQRPGMRITGVDCWPDILTKAQKKIQERQMANVTLQKADATALPFPDGAFDWVVCVNVFLNLPSDDIFYRSLKEMLRVCKKGGCLLFDIRNAGNPILNVKYRLAKYYDATVRNLPLRTYRLSAVAEWLTHQGLEIEEKIALGLPGGILAPIVVLKVKKP